MKHLHLTILDKLARFVNVCIQYGRCPEWSWK